MEATEAATVARTGAVVESADSRPQEEPETDPPELNADDRRAVCRLAESAGLVRTRKAPSRPARGARPVPADSEFGRTLRDLLSFD